MPDLSPRENYLRTLRHEENEYIPLSYNSGGDDVAMAGLICPPNKGDPTKNIPDGFGVHWVASDSAVGGLIPRPGEFILKDVTRWKQDITIPNVKDYNWETLSQVEFAMMKPDRSRSAIGFMATCGIWERLAALMGFEEAMIALVEEPEACYDLFTAITDFKIALAEVAVKYYHADTFINFDDIATQTQLFMSPDTYRRLIKPHHKRLNDAVHNFGMFPVQHTCGHAEGCVEDYIETGADAWNTVQTSNDIAGLLDKYGGKFCFEGGFDMNGRPGQPDATVEEVIADVERCFREYGSKKGYIFFGAVLASMDAKDAATKTAAIAETVKRLRFGGTR